MGGMRRLLADLIAKEQLSIEKLEALILRIEQLEQVLTAGSQGDAENVEAVEEQTATLLAGLDAVKAAQVAGNALMAKPAPWNAMADNGALILGTATKLLRAAPGAGLRNTITHLQVRNTNLTAEATVQILDGTTIIWSQPVGAGASLAMPVALVGSVNAALNVRLAAAITLGVAINAQGYAGP